MLPQNITDKLPDKEIKLCNLYKIINENKNLNVIDLCVNKLQNYKTTEQDKEYDDI